MFRQKTCSCPIAGLTESSLLEIFGPKAHSISASLLSDPTHLQGQARSTSLYFPSLLPGHLLSIPNLMRSLEFLQLKAMGLKSWGNPGSPGTSGNAGVALMLPIPLSAPHHLLWILPVAEVIAQIPREERESALPTPTETSMDRLQPHPTGSQAHACMHLWEEDGC